MTVPPILKKKKVLIPAIIILLIAGLVFAKGGPAAPELTTAPVEKIDLVQTVSETGSVEANVEVTFGWETSGKVVQILKKVGDQVKQGQLVARLQNNQQAQRLNQAVASLRSAEAALALKLAGPAGGEINQSLAALDKAKAGVTQAEAELSKAKINADISLKDAEKAVETAQNNLQLVSGGGETQIIADAYADLINTLKTAGNTLSTELNTADTILGIDAVNANDGFEKNVGIQNLALLDTAKFDYYKAKASVTSAQTTLSTLTSASNQTNIDMAAPIVQNAVYAMQTLLTNVYGVLNASIVGGSFTQTNLDTLKSSISTAQTNVNTTATNVTNGVQAVGTAKNSYTTYSIAYSKTKLTLEQTKKQAETNIITAETNLTIQKASLASAQASHDTLIAKPRGVDIAGLQAEVQRQRAFVAEAQNEYAKTNLVALTDGVLTKLDIDIGETVVMNTTIATIMSSGLVIKVDISESDIAKVMVKDPVAMTLDAFEESIEFTGEVAAIDPASTEISGVMYYKTTITLLDKKGHDIRPGMTANIHIKTDEKKGVLVIPSRAINEQDGKKMVRVLTNKEKGLFEEREVETGIRGDDGKVEITKGLNDEEEVVTFVKE